jgi:hypothetical protein
MGWVGSEVAWEDIGTVMRRSATEHGIQRVGPAIGARPHAVTGLAGTPSGVGPPARRTRSPIWHRRRREYVLPATDR